ncbi:MAG: (2Fe-2S) ferredoxin domain-containing protein [Thermoanaerobaculia bacterium]
MARYRHHIFICTNRRSPEDPRGSCNADGSEKLRARFKEEVARRGLKKTVRANGSGCLDHCEHGPTVVVYPEAVWYGRVRPEDVAEILDSHIVGGRPVERLLMPEECINAPCPHRRRAPKDGGRA